MITVVVGTHGVSFPVHESLICLSSEFFRNARKPEWSAGKPQVVDLIDEVPVVFEVYLHWLYFKTLPTVGIYNDHKCPEFESLARCYVLGEMLIDKKFKNAIVDALTDILEEMKDEMIIPGSFEINIIYAGTTEGSPGRKLMVDIWATIAGKTCKTALDECHPDFVLDLAKEFLELDNTIRPRPWKTSLERYYES